jgi:hypothetical protein
LPFEDEGVVHLTSATNYTALCGRVRLDGNYRDSEEVLVYARVARCEHKTVTCIECAAAFNPEPETTFT